jgi:hypothetical protein
MLVTRARWKLWSALGILCLLLGIPAAPCLAVEPNHPEIVGVERILAALAAREIQLDEVRALGLSVFSTPFNSADGYGDGRYDPDETDPLAFGQRPTLQGNGLFLRVNGLDAQSCNECHAIVSHATRPPTLGLAGVGGSVTNALIMPSLIDVADSSDDRVGFRGGHVPLLPLVRDGVADFNGRVANPPFLYGAGGVELLAKEMTADLQRLLADARAAAPGTVTPLDTKGVSFGALVTLEGGHVDLSGVEGIGPEDKSSVPPDDVLVVRPFGLKGEKFSVRDFARGAMQFHFGIQPVEVVDAEGRGGVDEDGDGVADEVTVTELSVLHVFGATNPPPVQYPRGRSVRSGLALFGELGCAECHRPFLDTRSRTLPLAFPEVPEDPFANVYLELDMTSVGFRSAPTGGIRVPLFADLKRHDMGPGLGGKHRQPRLHDGAALGRRRHGSLSARRPGHHVDGGHRDARRRGPDGERPLRGPVRGRPEPATRIPRLAPDPVGAQRGARAHPPQGARRHSRAAALIGRGRRGELG